MAFLFSSQEAITCNSKTPRQNPLTALIALLIVLFSGTLFMAQAASSIGGKHLKDIPDIYAALGLTPTVKKDSLIVIQNYKDGSNFKERFDAYEISKDASLIRSVQLRDDDTISNTSYNAIGMPVAVSTRYSDGTMPLAVVHANRVTNSGTNPFNYYVDKPAYDGKKPSLSRTVTAKSPQISSGYMPGFQQINGIKSGILLPGNPREFFAFATTWPSGYTREVFRIDLFSLSSDVKDFKHEKSITLDTATTNGGQFMRIAAGNFMGSGKKEIAVLSNHIDTWKFHLNVYSLEMVNNGKELYITHIVKDMEVYKNDAKVDYKERDMWFRKAMDMWFRKAMGDIVMADFDGDGRDEIAVIYKGYAAEWSNYSNTGKTISNNMKENFGTFWGSIHVDMFKYDATGKTARKTNSATRNYS